jgi:hypothetical protein
VYAPDLAYRASRAVSGTAMHSILVTDAGNSRGGLAPIP